MSGALFIKNFLVEFISKKPKEKYSFSRSSINAETHGRGSEELDRNNLLIFFE